MISNNRYYSLFQANDNTKRLEVFKIKMVRGTCGKRRIPRGYHSPAISYLWMHG